MAWIVNLLYFPHCYDLSSGAHLEIALKSEGFGQASKASFKMLDFG